MPNIPTPVSTSACTWATSSASPTPQSFPTINTGATVDAFSVKVNKTSALLETLCRYAFGGYCVLEGLTFSYAGLSLTVAVGLAAVDGIVAVYSALLYSLPDNQATVNIWLKSDGTLTHTLNATPPAGKAVYIGQVTTSGGSVTAATTEGVLYARCGGLWRTMSATPSDSPPSTTRVFTQVGTDLYIWNGTAHKQITLV